MSDLQLSKRPDQTKGNHPVHVVSSHCDRFKSQIEPTSFLILLENREVVSMVSAKPDDQKDQNTAAHKRDRRCQLIVWSHRDLFLRRAARRKVDTSADSIELSLRTGFRLIKLVASAA